MRQEVTNQILVFLVALLLLWTLLRESIVVVWQQRQVQEQIIKIVNDLETRMKKLEAVK